jgi:HEAT repeat protein
MLRTAFTWGLLGLAAAGCGTSQSPPPAAAPAASDGAAASPRAVPTDASGHALESAPAAPPTAQAAPAVDPVLRELAARLVVSDGQGGWRSDPQASAELERLGARGRQRLWRLLEDAAADVRRGAAFALLGAFDPANSEQVAALVALLDDPDRSIRFTALSAVKQMRREDQVAVLPRLAAMLQPAVEERPENRAASARLLGSLKEQASDAIDKLTGAAASDPDAKVRVAALAAVVQIAEPRDSLAPLTAGLRDAEPAVRQLAAARLRQLGAAAAPAAADLAGALADAEPAVRESAAEALIRIGPPAVQPLADQLASPHVEARKYALACLAKIGPAARPALAAIQKCQQDADADVRRLAAAALMQIQ